MDFRQHYLDTKIKDNTISDIHEFVKNALNDAKKPQVHEAKGKWFLKAAAAAALTVAHAVIPADTDRTALTQNTMLRMIPVSVCYAAQTDKNLQQISKDNVKGSDFSDLFRLPDDELNAMIKANRYNDLIKYMQYIKDASKNLDQDSEKFKAGIVSWLKTVDIKADIDEYSSIWNEKIKEVSRDRKIPRAAAELRSYNLEQLKKGPQLKQINETLYHLEDGTKQKNEVSYIFSNTADTVNKLIFRVARPEDVKSINDYSDNLIRILKSIASNPSPKNRTWTYIKNTFKLDSNYVFTSETDTDNFNEYIYDSVRAAEAMVKDFRTATCFIGKPDSTLGSEVVIAHQIKILEKKIGKLSPEAVNTIKDSYSRVAGTTFPQVAVITPENGKPRLDFEEIYFKTSNGSKCEIFIMHNNINIDIPHKAFIFNAE